MPGGQEGVVNSYVRTAYQHLLPRRERTLMILCARLPVLVACENDSESTPNYLFSHADLPLWSEGIWEWGNGGRGEGMAGEGIAL